jgi:thioredoxin reductase (NADPH)
MSIYADPSLFPTLTSAELVLVKSLAVPITYADGAPVFRAGDAELDLCVVEHGAIDIRNPTDNDALIVTHVSGQFAGDIDLLTGRPVLVSAFARGETRVLRVPYAMLRTLLNRVPSFGEKLIIAFTRRREVLAKIGKLGIKVIGAGQCKNTNLVREFLYKNFVPFTWIDAETVAGREMVSPNGEDCPMPVVDCGGGRVLVNPSLRELARCAGVWRPCPAEVVDLAVVGAGPAGISAAVYAASEGLSTLLLDRLGPGGQAGASSKIENFIGFPAGLTGTELATRGVLQMLKFGARMAAPVLVERMEASSDLRAPRLLYLDCKTVVQARIVLLATGVRWRRLPARGADRFEAAGVHYVCTAVEGVLYDDRDVAVVGGGNSAGQAAMYLAECCRTRRVHLIIRSRLGPNMSEYLASRIRETANVVVHEYTEVTDVEGGHNPETIRISRTGSTATESLPCAGLFVFIGADPAVDWLPRDVARDKLGYLLTGSDVLRSGRWPLPDRDPCPLETTLPGVLAAGDVRAGSTKRVGFAVGDGSLAVTCVHRLLSVG